MNIIVRHVIYTPDFLGYQVKMVDEIRNGALIYHFHRTRKRHPMELIKLINNSFYYQIRGRVQQALGGYLPGIAWAVWLNVFYVEQQQKVRKSIAEAYKAAHRAEIALSSKERRLPSGLIIPSGSSIFPSRGGNGTSQKDKKKLRKLSKLSRKYNR